MVLIKETERRRQDRCERSASALHVESHWRHRMLAQKLPKYTRRIVFYCSGDELC